MKLFKELIDKGLYFLKNAIIENRKKIRISFLLLLVPMLLLILLPFSDTGKSLLSHAVVSKSSQENLGLPLNSFAFVEVKMKQVLNICIEDNDCERSIDDEIMGSSSGFFYVYKDELAVITAAHSCTIDQAYILFLTSIGILESFSYEISITDFNGNKAVYSIKKIDVKKDLCLLVSKDNSNQSALAVPLKISKIDPVIGDKVFNMSAAMGIFKPESLLFQFSGYYSGTDDKGDSLYTVPAAPGSSGSPILNQNNEVVGVIHSTLLDFKNVSASANIKSIRNFLENK